MSKAEILEDLKVAIKDVAANCSGGIKKDQTRLINYVSASLGYFKEDGITHQEIRELVVEYVTQ